MPDTDLSLDALADQADEVSTTMHAAIRRIDELADRLLDLIEDVPGDREHNYALYADLKHSAQEAHRIHVKAQTVSRHARAKSRPAAADEDSRALVDSDGVVWVNLGAGWSYLSEHTTVTWDLHESPPDSCGPYRPLDAAATEVVLRAAAKWASRGVVA